MKTFFSIIIPVKAINKYVYENIKHIKLMSQKNWEVLIVTNEDEPNPWNEEKNIFLFSSGRVAPGIKRDLAAKNAKGNILVFLDDDSYPIRDYLNVAQNEFKDEKTIAIGGPGITPESDGLIQKISGATFFSRFSGGAPERYLSIAPKKIVTEWPSVNLALRRSAFEKIGGFNSNIWPGEDTVFCSKLNSEFGLSIKYLPELIVFHHRRSDIIRHLNQVMSYGRQRGFLYKTNDQSSQSLQYLFPPIFFLFVTTNPIILFFDSNLLNLLVTISWSLYFLIILIIFRDLSKHCSILMTFAGTLLSIGNHFFYGLGFLIGITNKQPKTFLR